MATASGSSDRRGGLRLFFGADFDGGSWPGPLAGGRDRCFGEAWVGPRRLLDILETRLGLSAAFASEAERAVAVVPQLSRQESCFSRSAAADPLATAIRVVRARDALWQCGWRGQAVSPRLHDLARATETVPPGIPDRLLAVVQAIDHRSPGIASIQLADPIAHLSLGWRRVLERLVGRGAEISPAELAPVAAQGDLGAAQAGSAARRFDPAGDGSLQLVRAGGWLAAADDLAAHLAAQPSLAGAVIIGGDSALDRALRRHGLPTLGAGAATDALLAVLPLALELSWSPPDPAAVHQLLTLPDGPIPGPVARRLIGALCEWPAVGSEAWDRALADGLDQLAAQRRSGAGARARALLAGGAPHGESCPCDEILVRAEIIETWARTRAYDGSSAAAGSTAHQAVSAQCKNLRELLQVTAQARIAAPDLRRYLALATEAATVSSPPPAEAGLVCVARPGGVAGPARAIIWWGFARELAERPAPPLVSRAEQRALAELGVELPDLGTTAIAARARWRRPLEQASETLLLVCPERDPVGAPLYPHPLWDEILAAMPPEARTSSETRIRHTRPDGRHRPLRVVVDPSPLPTPVRRFTAPGPIPARDVESPTGLETLLGCSLAWTLTYHGELFAGTGEAPLGPSPLLAGSLAHAILRRVMMERPVDADAAAERARHLFEDRGPTLAAPLFLPTARAQRARVRREITESVRALVAMLLEAGAAVQAVEARRSRPALGGVLAGTPDLVVERGGLACDVVIDFEWSDHDRRRDALERGAALQLAAHAHLLEDDGRVPAVAYLIVSRRRLLAEERAAIAGSTKVDAVPPQMTWAAARQAVASRRAELGGGVVLAPGNPDDAGEAHPGDSQLSGDRLDIAPACGSCRFAALCGHAFADGH